MASPSTLQPTLQQIDELDALLKQMLTLPTAPSDPAEKPQPVEEKPETTYRTPVTTSASVPASTPPAEPPELEPKMAAAPLPASTTFRPAPPSTLPKKETTVPNPWSRLSAMQFASSAAPTPAAPASSLLSRALGGINRQFDQRLERLGVWGRWLGRPAGRNLLGLLGLLAIVLAAALLLRDWVDWSR
jgi:hypothetical protein